MVVKSAEGLSGLSRNPTGGAKGKHNGPAPCFTHTQSSGNSFYSLFTDNLYLCGTSATVKTIWRLWVNQIYLEQGNFSPAFYPPWCPITALNPSCDWGGRFRSHPQFHRQEMTHYRAGWLLSILATLEIISASLGAAHRDAFGNVWFPSLSGVERKATVAQWVNT